jgi:hypothetical protein
MKISKTANIYAGLLGLLTSAYFIPQIPIAFYGQPWNGGMMLSGVVYNFYYVIVPLILVGTSIWLIVANNSRAALAASVMFALTLLPVLLRAAVISVQTGTAPVGLLRLPFLVFFASSVAGMGLSWQLYSNLRKRRS